MNMKSLIQFLHQSDGSIVLDGRPDVELQVIEDQGHVVGRNWQDELGLPKYQEEWEALAQVRGMSGRHIRFVLMDESPLRLPGHPRFDPTAVILPDHCCPFELGHSGFVVGVVYGFLVAPVALPFEPTGSYIMGYARLFDSALADAAWEGLCQGIFGHVCENTWRADVHEPWRVVQVTLTPGDYAGCPGTKIVTWWER